MTQEELYIWLLNCDSGAFPNFNSEFLKNYEIAKLFLEKFGIGRLHENEQRILNPEAVSSWVMFSDYVYLKYDIPEILELLPERIEGLLSLSDSKIQSLPELESVGGYLNLRNSQTQSLPQLKSVGGWLDLQNFKIESLPELEFVGDKIQVSLGEETHWKSYFNESGRPHLAKVVREKR